MGLQNCEITLDNPWNTYYAGQTLNGQVKLQLNSPKNIRGIIVRFLGEANTKWSETKKVRDDQGKEVDETEELTGHEEYFENHYYLLGAKNGSEINLPSGEHTYPFSCVLPGNLPSSYEGEFGHVRYTIKVTLDRPWKFDQDTKMAFTIISPLDLNQNARLKEPMALNLEKSFCCFCCKSGPLKAEVIIPCGGYVPGQSIPITADITNASNVKVERLRVILRKTVVFKTNHPRRDLKKEKTTISEISVGPVEEHSSKNWQQNIEIPPLPPSNLINCGIIDLDYELKIELNVSGAHRDLEGKLPITLGTIPLATTQLPNKDVPQQQPTVPIQDPSQAPTQPVSPSSPGDAVGWNLYPSIPPPSYGESEYRANIVDKNDSQHTRVSGGQNDFAPRYPVYASAPTLPNVQN
ncbi:arrestin domain-containing protein 17 [Contarinia nasturtii]|uniref:arrestin domain-containing protein 17 n=1 Tax=Contarinia nasturtii TaxID=265458 RepID=UPI0012D4ACDC|nr:arrestin domain-containing protein 17 [Contarinia nasturtii]XP_031621451.1 arrestin domain-containing protein 17 [Contarinia nasturtii]XP_031621452.1 arrestin domain-containing protein 17 [Contarinia nasturtii]XP_031621453.1 arrestin domain-containing protein 17 [Contarinia nasturtii]